MTMSTYDEFLQPADEWLINYAIQPHSPNGLSSVCSFSVGHAVELYLKAAYMRFTGNQPTTHNLVKFWKDCEADPLFMPSFRLRDSIYNLLLDKSKHQLFIQGPISNLLQGDDFNHYVINQELYKVFILLTDYKYFGAPPKYLKLNRIMYWPRSEYWITFFKEIRSYLNHPAPDYNDVILFNIKNRTIPTIAISYLNRLYN